ncbi:MAG: hypothetical protein JWO79_3799 [Actinomycetia bacterium]|nr:hypothetical protein [Actinomycetes bacterium]MDQ1656180.1 hypothetical protein [Cryptosporangiaceae bacterium]
MQTARLATKLAASGKATGQYLDVMLTEAENTAGAAEQTFAAVQPPTRTADRLRGQLLVVLGECDDVLSQLRIEVRRDNLAALDKVGSGLDPLNTQLTEFVTAHQA